MSRIYSQAEQDNLEQFVGYLLRTYCDGTVTIPRSELENWPDKTWKVERVNNRLDEELTFRVVESPERGSDPEVMGEAAGLLSHQPGLYPEAWRIERAVWLLSRGMRGKPHSDLYYHPPTKED